MIQLMTAKNPVEFATELLMPFTVEDVRHSQNPLQKIKEIDSEKYQLDSYIERFIYYFEICGCERFAAGMARDLAFDLDKATRIILNFTKAEIIEAAHFHGNIGEGQKTLDAFAAAEQALVFNETEKIKTELKELGQTYLQKFGMKFLISAKHKTGAELLEALIHRLTNTEKQEIENAQQALWEISLKRFTEKPLDDLTEQIEGLRQKYRVDGCSLAINLKGHTQALNFGSAEKTTWFELASLSKTLASAFALEYFSKKNIPLETPVDALFAKTSSTFRLNNSKVQLQHLMNHSALNMHYVKGYPLNENIPPLTEILKSVDVIAEPGKEFHYSGGGFIVLEHLIESLEKKSIKELTAAFLKDISFEQKNLSNTNYATGYFDDGSEVNSSRLMFPAFAAGALGTASGMAHFLNDLTKAFHHLEGAGHISHDTAVTMLHGSDKGSRAFMGCDMGLGVFTADCGPNKLALHQGANEGFRALYIHCFDGPDQGSGVVILANADNRGVLFISEVAQLILKALNIQGMDFEKFSSEFDMQNIPQEQLVNSGYKNLIFKAFTPTRPNEITSKGPADPLANFNILGLATISHVSNEKFARAENMISPYLPIFDPELFEKQGKTMDSWETVRHNTSDFDEMILDLHKASNINYVALSTKYHDGNQAEFVRILGQEKDSKNWIEILPKQKMTGHSYFNTKSAEQHIHFSRIKVEMYPDGGLSRVSLYNHLPEAEIEKFNMKEPVRFSDPIPKTHKPLSLKYEPTKQDIENNQKQKNYNLAGLAYGAQLISASNEHYGPAIQVISPFPPLHMFDGLESARSRKPDHFEEAVIQLAEESPIQKIILDFKFFVNNNPREVSLEGLCNREWILLVDKTNVKAFAGNQKEFKINSDRKFTQLKLKTFPDGGINRIYVY
jgi:allantoicase